MCASDVLSTIQRIRSRFMPYEPLTRSRLDVIYLLNNLSNDNLQILNRAEEQEQVNPILQKREEEITKLYNQMCEVVSLTQGLKKNLIPLPHMFLSARCMLACTLQPVPKRLHHQRHTRQPYVFRISRSSVMSLHSAGRGFESDFSRCH